jgi:hypothetical protein
VPHNTDVRDLEKLETALLSAEMNGELLEALKVIMEKLLRNRLFFTIIHRNQNLRWKEYLLGIKRWESCD